MSGTEPKPTASIWARQIRDEAAESAAKGRWGIALIVVGWVHLAAFAACQGLVNPSIRGDLRHPALWVADVVASLLAIRSIAGKGWYRDSPASLLIAKLWGTFLILAFSLATLNNLSGWDSDWFKPPWATLSSFGFAAMAWLFDIRFLVFAVLMYLTGLMMIALPRWSFLIFGASWWLALQVLGSFLWRRARQRGGRSSVGRSPSRRE